MDTWIWLVLVAALIIVVAALAWMLTRQRRSERLRDNFGPEYDRAVAQHGDRRQAESDLEQRRQRVEKFHVQPLRPEQQARFSDAWRATQARFVDDPGGAIREADELIADVMRARGYPVGDFESRAADISVDHPSLVSNYRAAHALALANSAGRATTEDLRQAMMHYRALFEDLLETEQPVRQESRR
jgi:ABC-type nickel/cobalt efflux system permease component RcnA